MPQLVDSIWPVVGPGRAWIAEAREPGYRKVMISATAGATEWVQASDSALRSVHRPCARGDPAEQAFALLWAVDQTQHERADRAIVLRVDHAQLLDPVSASLVL